MSKFLEGLNERQQEAVQATEGPVLVIAGAGSGKTKTLTHRIAYLIEEKGIFPHQILAVTFTNKAAGELRQRAANLLKQNPKSWVTWQGFHLRQGFPLRQGYGGQDGGQVGSSPALGTFHSICARILREEAGKIGYKRSFVIYDAADQKAAIKNVMRLEGISPKEINPNTILGMISRAKNELLTPDEMSAQVRGPIEKLASRLYASHQSYLKRNDAMDFDDLLMKTVEIFKKHPDVLKKYQDKWQYIMIDEYQDTNHAQYAWARLLAQKSNNIFVVGDDWQGIYSWRGATIRNILEFEKDYPGAQVIRLEQNYRSTADIVELGNLIIAGNRGQMKKKLWTEKAGERKPEVWQVADEAREAEKVLEVIASEYAHERGNPEVKDGIASSASTPPRNDTSGEVTYDYESEGAQELGILDKIMGSMGYSKTEKTGLNHSRLPINDNRLSISSIPFDMGQQKIPWNNYAVLYRTNAQSRALEETLLKYGVPYRLIGGIRFYERKEIKDTLAYLRFLLNPNDAIALARVINEPSRGIGEKSLASVQQRARSRHVSLLSIMLSIEDEAILPPNRSRLIKDFALVLTGLSKKLMSWQWGRL